MASETELRDESECAKLCIDFAHHLDARRYDAVLELFTDDGTLDRLGTVFSGHDGIRRFLEGRSANVVTRHVCSNIRTHVRSSREAVGHCYVVFFSGIASDGAELPVQSSPPTLVEYHDAYVRTDAGWRIQERRIRAVFG